MFRGLVSPPLDGRALVYLCGLICFVFGGSVSYSRGCPTRNVMETGGQKGTEKRERVEPRFRTSYVSLVTAGHYRLFWIFFSYMDEESNGSVPSPQGRVQQRPYLAQSSRPDQRPCWASTDPLPLSMSHHQTLLGADRGTAWHYTGDHHSHIL